ncbi:UDP-2,3-diacylglucosamine diphosphatase [Shewanella chilikensis]|uniref:UDP-2,3-diacylglucosamine diphosphatase n=1 Tax=Shewanella chilikensis TaxID=558541 RepID=UPI00399B0593
MKGSKSLVNKPSTFHPYSRRAAESVIKLNALWLSDIHLGSIDCKAEYLLHFLNSVQPKVLYLVGDIVDIWALKRRVFWPESHNQLLQKLLQMAQSGIKLVYLPGNHDELFKDYHQLQLADVIISKEYRHQTLSGKTLLMLHGDQFDSEVCIGRITARLGNHLYDVLMFLNRHLHKVRRRLGYPYWSLAGFIKQRVGKAQQAINSFREAVVRYGRKQKVDGIICGHIHQPELTEMSGFIYANDGDWVENCTLLTETLEGELQLERWNEQLGRTEVLKRFAWQGQEQQAA